MRIKVFVTLFIVLTAGAAIMVAGELRTAALEQGSHPTLYTDEIRPATNNSDSVTVNASRIWFKGNEIQNIISQDYYVGRTTSEYDGNLSDESGLSGSGYDAAHSACQSAYGNASHVCTVNELLASYEANVSVPSSGSARIIGGPPGFTANANDCGGWESDDIGFYSKIWRFDETDGYLSSCQYPAKFACCGGST